MGGGVVGGGRLHRRIPVGAPGLAGLRAMAAVAQAAEPLWVQEVAMDPGVGSTW